jgi:hypothetical protein
MFKKIFLSIIISLPVVLTTFLSVQAVSYAHENATEGRSSTDECNIDVDLQGSVSGNHATVRNWSLNPVCEYQATLAVYDSPKDPDTDGWIEAQTLIGSKTVPVSQGATVDIIVEGEGSSCWKQSDLVRGSEVKTPPYYSNAMAVNVYQSPSCIATPTPSEATTETPTPELTATPTVTETPAPTATPTPTSGSSESSNTSSGSSSNSNASSSSNSNNTPQPAVQTLAYTGNTFMIYFVILAGAASIISGMVLRKFTR